MLFFFIKKNGKFLLHFMGIVFCRCHLKYSTFVCISSNLVWHKVNVFLKCCWYVNDFYGLSYFYNQLTLFRTTLNTHSEFLRLFTFIPCFYCYFQISHKRFHCMVHSKKLIKFLLSLSRSVSQTIFKDKNTIKKQDSTWTAKTIALR